MNLLVLKYRDLFNYLDNFASENLGFYFSLFLHMIILLFAIGIPNFFEPKPIIVSSIIPIEIINVSDITSIPKEVKDTQIAQEKKINIKKKKFNSSDNQEIKKIEIKDKPAVQKKEYNETLQSKKDIFIEEKKEVPLELQKEKIKIQTNDFESLPSKKIKPKLKPKIKNLIIEKTKNSDVKIEIKDKPNQDNNFDLASIMKDLRNDKTIDIENEEDSEKESKDNKSVNQDEKNLEESAKLSISEIDLVLQQLRGCFIGQSGVKMDKNWYVNVSAKVRENRRVVEQSVRIIDTNIPKSNSVYIPITESAMRVLLNPECIPLKLPEDKYESWKDLTLKFDYGIMKGN